MDEVRFDTFFDRATAGLTPFDYQSRLACGERNGRSEADWLSGYANCRSLLINVPTGCGKTAAVVLAWLWNRVALQRDDWPRRLVYCLPMRVLVEQTHENVRRWVRALMEADLGLSLSVVGSLAWLTKHSPVVLMGGEDEADWHLHPERDVIVIGTQDVLLSRALNRGYAASRTRWPLHFGLLNTDCLWVFDEAQLMGPGLASTAQLEAFRWLLGSKDGHGCCSIWMSATLQRDWLKTVDFRGRVDGLPLLQLTDADKDNNEELSARWIAQKPLAKTKGLIGDVSSLAPEVLKTHKPGTRTIVVVNTVERACELTDELGSSREVTAAKDKKDGRVKQDAIISSTTSPRLVLLHSRFRPRDRQEVIKKALASPPPEGTIVVSTQVMEAGVDVSATTLFTELAPWPSLVQRFGRCNRQGHDADARVFWIDLPVKDAYAAEIALPYELTQLKEARGLLTKCETGIGLEALGEATKRNSNQFSKAMQFEHGQVVRLHEITDLFGSEPDLAGGFTDISPFIRDTDRDVDVRVFWRSMSDHRPHADASGPGRDELCAVPCRQLRAFLGTREAWEWDDDTEQWQSRRAADVRPGMSLMLDAALGGYDSERGWTAKPGQVTVLKRDEGDTPDGLTSDRRSLGPHWQTIEVHTARVEKRVMALVEALSIDEILRNAVIMAARWHDVGKGHPKWQSAWRTFTRRLLAALDHQGLASISRLNGLRNTLQSPPEETALIAKFPSAWDVSLSDSQDHERQAIADLRRRIQFRPGLRHEAASALATMDAWRSGETDLSALAVYLVASHHGKVRTVLRSRPASRRHMQGGQFVRHRSTRTVTRSHAGDGSDAFGVRDGDQLPGVGPLPVPHVRLSTAAKAFGAVGDWTESGSFEFTSLSWVELVGALVGPLPGDSEAPNSLQAHEPRALGPFRLAYLEAILVAADCREDEEVVQ